MSIAEQLSFSTATTAITVASGTAGALLYQSATDTTGFLNIGASGYVLTSNGSTPQWSSSQGGGGGAGNGYTGSQGSQGVLGYTGSRGEPGAPSYELGLTGYTGSASTTAGYTGSAALQNLPANSQSSSYTLVVADVGKYINITSGTVTVPASVFSSGDVMSVYNNTITSTSIIPAASVTMYLSGSGATGTRTVLTRGLATILCVGANQFVITGAGVG